jgi:D-alanine-D-alanine ligase
MSRIAVLKGGRSLERPVSLKSGARVEDALERLGHEVLALDVGPDLVSRLRAATPDVAFVALHGEDGEDGAAQELLEVLGIPYTGSPPSACARCWDKALTKHALLDAGLPTPEFHAFTQAAFRDLGAAEALPEIEQRLGFPIVVKPARQGSALGIKFARSAADLPSALVAAFAYDTTVLLERFVAGRDLAVSVLDGTPLPVVEAIPNDEAAYDFEHRYEIGATAFRCPAELPGDAAARAQEMAMRTWTVLGLAGVARVDLMLDASSGELWVLEANTIPGMTETSLLPMAADAAGIGFDQLIAQVLTLA